MNMNQFRAVIAALLLVTVGFGIYLGWHQTHKHQCVRGVYSSVGDC